jgi:hypothetical protein
MPASSSTTRIVFVIIANPIDSFSFWRRSR